jgi:hypothetical protein
VLVLVRKAVETAGNDSAAAYVIGSGSTKTNPARVYIA